MSISTRVQKDMTDAMKARNKERASALRMVLSRLQLAAKEASGEFGEEQEIKVLMSEKKRRLQAAEAFDAAGRDDRAGMERAEAAIIDDYLPQALEEAELEKLADKAIVETGAASVKDMGKVMSALMPKVAGRADGNAVSAVVKKRLG